MKAIIDAVGELSKLFIVPQLSTIASFAGPITGTLDALFGQGDQRYELGLHQTFGAGAEDVQAGYFVAAATDEDRNPLEIDDLAVKDGRLVYAADPDNLVENLDYVLFRQMTFTERSDYRDLESINKWVKEAEKAIISDESGSLQKAKRFLTNAKYEAWNSEDLTEADRVRLPSALQAGFDEFRATVLPEKVFLLEEAAPAMTGNSGKLMDHVLNHLNDTTPDEALERSGTSADDYPARP